MNGILDRIDRRFSIERASARDYQAENLSKDRYLVHEPGIRGFYAEFSTVVHAMVYAWTNDLQFIIDSSRWGFRSGQGWSDYFTPLFREYKPTMESQVEFRTSDRVHPSAKGRHVHYSKILFSRPGRADIGDQVILGDHPINIHFLRMLLLPTQRVRQIVAERIESLGLPDQYVALHLRRGDKIGDQDILYPAEAYLERITGDHRGLAVFAMSDDYAAIEEVAQILAKDESKRPLFSITGTSQSGFDADRLGEGKLFLHGGTLAGSRAERNAYIDDEVIRLLAETIIAAQSQRFIGSYFSNVGKVIRDLHQQPGQVTLMQEHHLNSVQQTGDK